jgi:anti-sigma regulatory factor (Ser/Thr protein kinase)
MWKVSQFGPVTAKLPRTLNDETMYHFIGTVLDEQKDSKCETVTFDFSSLEFIYPVGIVVLSNLIEYLDRMKVKVRFAFHRVRTTATVYLDDAGFFERYVGEKAFDNSRVRPTTMPLQLISSARSMEFVHMRLIPWIARSVQQPEGALAALRTSLQEILHNVDDHSGVDFGCTFAQHFPQKEEIHIAISDFGHGIPDVVRRKVPDATDARAMWLACQEGFTTKTNVDNRGAGLPTLARYVTLRNGGTVLIAGGGGQISASRGHGGELRLTPRAARGIYPGTLVRVILQTNALMGAAQDVEPEEFEW